MNFKMLTNLRNEKPLVHHITNIVSINDCANITLCFGALPVMSNSIDEVTEVVCKSDSLVLNMGTLSREQFKAILIAGQMANKKNVPIVIDPVGIGTTTSRTKRIFQLVNTIKPSVIKGNAAEINILAGRKGQIKGVESLGTYHNIIDTAKLLAVRYECTVVVTGQVDIITNGIETYLIDNGSIMMSKLVGTGCMAASVIGCFLGIYHNQIDATLCAVVSYEVAAELAAERIDVKGPGTFKPALFDECYSLQAEEVEKRAKIRKVK
ncbi:MAG: hydroxyethylthiazole kinase [Clostridia bacterium]|nr:hydroxyethylthiazole kinase [Clostridia bacterium]MDN5323386.1 hydroxyethylthiazole kinase [Clostridia bacterium]